MKAAGIESLANLLSFSENSAKERLNAAQEFLPFGAFINSSEKLEALGVSLNRGDTSATALTLLYGMAKQLIEQNNALAFAVTSNVTIPEKFNPPFPDGI
jgi:hypothetical protein